MLFSITISWRPGRLEIQEPLSVVNLTIDSQRDSNNSRTITKSVTVVVDEEEFSVPIDLLRSSCTTFANAIDNRAQNPGGKIYLSNIDAVNINSITIFEIFVAWLQIGRVDLGINGLKCYTDMVELGVDLKILGGVLGMPRLEDAARKALVDLKNSQ